MCLKVRTRPKYLRQDNVGDWVITSSGTSATASSGSSMPALSTRRRATSLPRLHHRVLSQESLLGDSLALCRSAHFRSLRINSAVS